MRRFPSTAHQARDTAFFVPRHVMTWDGLLNARVARLRASLFEEKHRKDLGWKF